MFFNMFFLFKFENDIRLEWFSFISSDLFVGILIEVGEMFSFFFMLFILNFKGLVLKIWYLLCFLIFG